MFCCLLVLCSASICSMFYVLCSMTMFYVLCSMFYVLCSMFYVLCSMFYVSCSIYSMFYTLYYSKRFACCTGALCDVPQHYPLTRAPVFRGWDGPLNLAPDLPIMAHNNNKNTITIITNVIRIMISMNYIIITVHCT
jgi:hypothetical protein